ncbi:DUF1735 domain-containing protein [Sphingobacterium sp. CZ-2]|uniref:DUF1735 domain-containing protein n=1 Tax=Sphingobacterium sp. CZ-2 TaxID=2557994 RepID=UPI00106F648A|nr:DUF1735 domain-containing protein [Sphingobacterium sp. CZ-2]QBR13389.1 DUF1735 domain-containing protein [Sphingobacterium sp. CZ-2]
MRNYYKIILGVIGMFSLTSCLKDENVLSPENGNKKNIVEFYNVTSPVSPGTAPYIMYVPTTLESVPEAEFEIAISYSGVEEGAPQDIVVNLEPTGDIVTTYNAKMGTKYNQLPTNLFEFPSSVTIKQGEKRAYAKVKVKPSLMDQSKSNVIGVKITSASHGIISGNFSSVIYSLPIKSIWDGTYTVSVSNDYGTIDANVGTFTEPGVRLSTVGPNLLRIGALWYTYSGYTEYQFNANNTSITGITAFSGSLRPATIDKIVLVDPVNKIFEVHWTAIGRGVKERYVRTGD